MEENLNKYYIRLNEDNIITSTFSTAFQDPTPADIEIGSGAGSQFRADSKVLSKELKEYADIENGLPLINDDGEFQLYYENRLIKKLPNISKQDIVIQNDFPLIFDKVKSSIYYLDNGEKIYLDI